MLEVKGEGVLVEEKSAVYMIALRWKRKILRENRNAGKWEEGTEERTTVKGI